ncbi:MAG TPA: nucleoside deaminase [Pseudothermotoga sp.]|nr:nucleoside deaminase [Pseudothermotoga sp.]HOK84253.1 nucleoside deaminase [Pseudothermotoga sp.]HPP71062.1 nucleoside deaminase [Pseudothermotoga sp.]
MNRYELRVVELCLNSLRNGSLPIGSVVVDNNSNIVSEGRNMIHENSGDNRDIYGNAIAHAELNALVKLNGEHLNTYTIYSSMEPCVMCAGAIYMSGIRNIVYGMKDYLAGGLNLYGLTDYYSRKKMTVHQSEDLGIIQAVLIGLLEDKEYVHRGGFWEIYLTHYKKEYLIAKRLEKEGFLNSLCSELDASDFVHMVRNYY